jgi:hypothetical protein
MGYIEFLEHGIKLIFKFTTIIGECLFQGVAIGAVGAFKYPLCPIAVMSRYGGGKGLTAIRVCQRYEVALKAS